MRRPVATSSRGYRVALFGATERGLFNEYLKVLRGKSYGREHAGSLYGLTFKRRHRLASVRTLRDALAFQLQMGNNCTPLHEDLVFNIEDSHGNVLLVDVELGWIKCSFVSGGSITVRRTTAILFLLESLEE